MHQLTGRRPNYDRSPVVEAGERDECAYGWDEVAAIIGRSGATVILVDTQPAVMGRDIGILVDHLAPGLVIDTRVAFRDPEAISAMVEPDLTDDPVFGRISGLEMVDFFDPGRLEQLRLGVKAAAGRVVVHGPGAALLSDGGLLVMAEVPRWETQARQRAHMIDNLGALNRDQRPALQYKRSYFVDWRVWDRHKQSTWERVDCFLDTAREGAPALVGRAVMDRALAHLGRRPFRVVPYFDPAPWGGQWMKEVCDLDRGSPNWGWCFDCVPEENSLILGFGSARFETPAANLVFREPLALLGEDVQRRFGNEFPIRFDFLDTMGGGNLSLQVHPLTAYISEHFGMGYTQDESYYMLDAGEGAGVYLGLREGINREAMARDLRLAQDGGPGFAADRYVNRFPAKRHDHFLIPAGTIHCSGAESMVLEISATPYIFTFKLWDWDRLGLDGRPRPIHLDHGLRNIQWDRGTEFARSQLVNVVTPLGEGHGWREERTGLHRAEFIETRRHWFTDAVAHDTAGGVNVLNLVEGEEAIVESPGGIFAPFTVHYAETFIVPAAVGPYVVRPAGPAPRPLATVKAFVRGEPGFRHQ
ncbi:MAG: class I mannose-6-phosphate isomerase [Candidatus Dormibacteria bacterium]